MLSSAGLADNGGSTKTVAFLAGSPAINAGNTGLAPGINQRGYVRTGGPDIGAFEFNAAPLRITSITRLANGRIVIQGLGVPNAFHTFHKGTSWPDVYDAPSVFVLANGAGTLFYEDANAPGLTRAFYRLSFP